MKLKGLSIEEQSNLIIPNLVTLGYRGSIAHGLYIPSTDPNSIDDKDVMGVFLAPKDYYLGLQSQKETIEKWYNEWDCVYYELKKFLRLLLKGNPNVLMMLWLNNQYILHSTEYWNKILEIRNAFVSKQVYRSFYGYAQGQLHRMTHASYQGYMGQKRKTLVDKFGFDTKNSSHLIRLLKMCVEFLVEGKLYVERTLDATVLLEIKKGEWTLSQVQEEAKKLFALCEEAYIRSTLPNEPDWNLVNKVCVEIIKDYLSQK